VIRRVWRAEAPRFNRGSMFFLTRYKKEASRAVEPALSNDASVKLRRADKHEDTGITYMSVWEMEGAQMRSSTYEHCVRPGEMCGGVISREGRRAVRQGSIRVWFACFAHKIPRQKRANSVGQTEREN
jgi:hypothetical protein